jgi:hypothetical protein
MNLTEQGLTSSAWMPALATLGQHFPSEMVIWRYGTGEDHAGD